MPNFQFDESGGAGHWQVASPIPTSSNPRSEHLKAARPLRASDIILGMTLVMLGIVLIVWLLGQIFSHDEQAPFDIENTNAGASYEPV